MNSQKQEIKTLPGIPLPLGANPHKDGIQFSIFSRHATAVSLLLFHTGEPNSSYDEIELDPEMNKTGDIWHVWVKEVGEGQLYGYTIDGPYEPGEGHRYNRNKLLIDPYSKAVTGNFKFEHTSARGYDPESPEIDLSFSETESIGSVPRSIVVSNGEDIKDRAIKLPYHDIIIYELHVKGFTRHETSGAEHKGTYKGLVEKIPYLQELGVTAVELLPVQEFDEYENININPKTGKRLKNYWGYSTLSFFAPKGSYSSGSTMGEQVREFKEMVKAFHDAGIEVILDVVYNHTVEGDQTGPTISFRGIDNSIYYILEEDKRYYKNYSGCGNTFNCNHPLVRDFILDSLRYWVVEMNIDGFRFDLASILGRDQDGNMLPNPPLIEWIEEDPILRDTKIIAEAWDAAGAYQVGDFPGRWAEWNGRYRDDVRQFWNGEQGTVGLFTTRFTGSSDLYEKEGRAPQHSINFITCHDGFTLNDLVSYNRKHNEENGEENRDGENNNESNNYGIEGVEATPFIDKMRSRMIKNFIATLFLSHGIPMLLAGDEFRRTQKGNNNSYCQDNDLSWINWDFLTKNREIFEFTRKIIQFRKDNPLLTRISFFTGKKRDGYSAPDISWHGHNVGQPDWGKKSHTIAALINGEYSREKAKNSDADIYIIFNASMISRFYEIPVAPSGRSWKMVIDTANASPDDIMEPGTGPQVKENRYYVRKLTTVVLIAAE
ncbi:MAG: glycogen debranching protein GlgX [bacterium]|nr:glycogen debranching protein GlgX [bacterium]